MTAFVPFTVALEVAALLLGGVLTLAASRAFRRTGSAPLRSLALGFAAVTAATAAGVLASATGLEAQTGLLVRDALTALGLGLLVHSLYAGEFVASTN